MTSRIEIELLAISFLQILFISLILLYYMVYFT